MIDRDVDLPMGNAELRLNFADLRSEVAEVKDIALETHDQAVKTNGRVNWLEKTAYTALGALPLLTFWAAWLTYKELDAPPPVQEEQIQAAVLQALDAYDAEVR